jgi:hypothetical protein
MRAANLIAGLILSGTALAVAACSSYGSSTGLNIGPPTEKPDMLYATNSNQNAVSIYTVGQANGSGPAYQIGGVNTTLNGPQYLAFDNSKNLWVTNYNPSTGTGSLVEIAALATGDVVPLISATFSPGRPRGIAITAPAPSSSPASLLAASGTASPSPSPTPVPALMVITAVNPTSANPSSIQLFTEGSVSPYQSIAGALTQLDLPSGIALDRKDNVYVTNLQGTNGLGSVEQFVLPTPSPTPKPTHTPSPTPSPSVSPSTSPSPSPTPTSTPTPINIAPNFMLAGPKTHLVAPTGIAVASNGYIYVADQGVPGASCAAQYGPAILVFAPQPKSKAPLDVAPVRQIRGCKTQLYAPTDVKLNSADAIYVADYSKKLGKGVILVFKPGARGNQPPTYFTSPGAVTGIGLVP